MYLINVLGGISILGGHSTHLFSTISAENEFSPLCAANEFSKLNVENEFSTLSAENEFFILVGLISVPVGGYRFRVLF